MLPKSAVATASALCILGWLLVFGVSADAQDRGAEGPTLLVLFGQAGSVTQDPSTGETVLEIYDGSHAWSCAIGDAPVPEGGSQIIAYCALSPGNHPTITRIAFP
jgi:hypothetical protein